MFSVPDVPGGHSFPQSSGIACCSSPGLLKCRRFLGRFHRACRRSGRQCPWQLGLSCRLPRSKPLMFWMFCAQRVKLVATITAAVNKILFMSLCIFMFSDYSFFPDAKLRRALWNEYTRITDGCNLFTDSG